MALTINDDSITLEIGGEIVATSVRVGERWTASTCSGMLDRNQAITALTLAERLAAGYGDDDPFVTAWREELSR